MTVQSFTNEKAEAWDDFVLSQDRATFFHLSGWKEVIERAFGFQTYYFYAESGGGIKGILPLALVRKPLFGAALISTPLCVYGGAITENESVHAELEEAALQKAKELDVQYLELRNVLKSPSGWLISDRFYTFRGALQDREEENLKAIPRKQRAEVRKGMKANLQTRAGQDIDVFYKVYAGSVRNLGTPVFAKKYLQVLFDVFANMSEVTTIYKDDRPLSSVLSFYYKDLVLPYYGGGLTEARQYRAYPYMYWEVMRRAVDRGASIFDFGRSIKGSGAFDFKKNFGFEPEALSYQYYLVKASELPDMDPHSRRNEIIMSCWKKLPLPVANQIGPVLYPVIV